MRGADPAADLAPELARVRASRPDHRPRRGRGGGAERPGHKPCSSSCRSHRATWASSSRTPRSRRSLLRAARFSAPCSSGRRRLSTTAWRRRRRVRVGGHASGGRGDGPERRGRPRGGGRAWQCLALARRYEQYGCRVFATKEAVAGASFFSFAARGRRPAPLVGNATTVSTVRAAFPRMQTVAESRAIAAEAREKFLWRPFAAATADDVPTCSDGDGDAPPELRGTGRRETAKPRSGINVPPEDSVVRRTLLNVFVGSLHTTHRALIPIRYLLSRRVVDRYRCLFLPRTNACRVLSAGDASRSPRQHLERVGRQDSRSRRSCSRRRPCRRRAAPRS